MRRIADDAALVLRCELAPDGSRAHLISDRTLATSLASRSLSLLSVVWCMSCAFSTSLLKPASCDLCSSTVCRLAHAVSARAVPWAMVASPQKHRNEAGSHAACPRAEPVPAQNVPSPHSPHSPVSSASLLAAKRSKRFTSLVGDCWQCPQRLHKVARLSPYFHFDFHEWFGPQHLEKSNSHPLQVRLRDIRLRQLLLMGAQHLREVLRKLFRLVPRHAHLFKIPHLRAPVLCSLLGDGDWCCCDRHPYDRRCVRCI